MRMMVETATDALQHQKYAKARSLDHSYHRPLTALRSQPTSKQYHLHVSVHTSITAPRGNFFEG